MKLPLPLRSRKNRALAMVVDEDGADGRIYTTRCGRRERFMVELSSRAF